MVRSLCRLTGFLVASAALGVGLASAAVPPSPARPVLAGLIAAALPLEQPDPRPVHARGFTPAAPAVTPAPTPLARVSSRPLVVPRPIPPPTIDAQAVALVNLDNGRLLWQSNAGQARAPASLTKIFTAMVAADLMGLNRMVTVPASITQLPTDSTVMGLTPGERLSVRELLDGVLIVSGNDAAETLAAAVTSRSAFIASMNAKASRLGLHSTHFLNPTGLDAAGHYSSASDLARAATYFESHYPALVTVAATLSTTIPSTATHKTFALRNLNKLLRTYPGVFGLKTGWTEAALGCLITTSSRGGHRLLAVMLGSPSVYHEMPKALDYGFELLGVLPRPAA
jgi:serine-type D-Ala-D-Ala carboxypeptidase (penicillin-binding protein 5/6)